MQNRRTMRKLCLIQQILVDKSPSYLYKIIEKQLHRPNSRLANRQQLINIAGQTNKYKKSFFPSTIVDWNNIDFDIKTSKTKNIFKKRLLNKIRPKKASFFNLKNTDDIRNLTMIRLNLSPLRAHKHNYNFSDTPTHSALSVALLRTLTTTCCSVNPSGLRDPPSCKKSVISYVLMYLHFQRKE